MHVVRSALLHTLCMVTFNEKESVFVQMIPHNHEDGENLLACISEKGDVFIGSTVHAADSNCHAADVILDQYRDSSAKPALLAAVICYQGVKTCSLSLIKKGKVGTL